jgi:hypothetical protein
MKRAALFITVLALASLGLAGPVLAAEPDNDTYTGRVSIGSIPWEATIDTTEATTAAVDDELDQQCDAPATDASVWYEHQAASDGALLFETLEADYSVGIFVATGAPGSLSLVTCGAFNVSFPTVAGETYSIVVFDFQEDGFGNGGVASLRLRELPPPPELEFTISPTGSFNAVTGSATIRGTVTCTGGDEYSKSFIDVQATQVVGRFRLNGYGGTTFTCDGSEQQWAAEVFSDQGKFGGGKASVRAFGFVCTESGCDEQEVTATVTLRR